MRKTAAIAALAAMVGTALPLLAGEVASNGGFENGTLITAPWSGLSNSGFSVIKSNARSGSYCLRYQASSAPSEYKMPHQSVTASAGQVYRASVWVKADTLSSGEALVGIEWNDANGNWISGVYLNPGSGVSGTTDWTRLSIESPRLPANAAKVYLLVYVKQGSLGTAYFDDASLICLDADPVPGLYSDAYRNRAADGDVTFVADLNLAVSGLSASGVTGEFVVPKTSGSTTMAAATLTDTYAKLTVPASQLATGTVTFRLKRNGSTVASKTLGFTKLASEPATGVRIDRRRHMVVNGQPFFPVGMYCMNINTSELPAYAAGGFNFLMPYARATVAQLDACQANGLKLFYTLQNFYPFHRSPSSGIVDDATAEAKVREHVALVKDHPALLGWYTNDETGSEHAEALAERYQLLQSLDPDHPTWIVVSQYDRMPAYMPTFDICGTDPYPSGASNYAKVYDYPALQVAGTFGIRPLIEAIFVSQNGSFLPSAADIRGMTWLSLCAGAEGICYYAYHNIRDGSGGETFEQRFAAVSQVASELREYEDVFLSNETPVAASVDGTSDIVCRTWKKGGHTYLAIANKTWNAVSGAVRLGTTFHAAETLLGEAQTLNGDTIAVTLPARGMSFLVLRDPSADDWAPEVSNVRMEQAVNGTVRVDYTLRYAPAAITLDILTNATGGAWASIGADNISRTWGDVNVLVQPGEHTLWWAAEKTWTDELPPRIHDVRAAVKAWPVSMPPDYMVVDLRPSSELGGAPRIRYFETAAQLPGGGVTNRKYKTDYLLMRKIPAKGMTYRMGSPSGEVGKSKSENTDWDGVEALRHVTLTNDFYLGVYELTRKQGITYTGYGNPSSVAGYEAYPVGGDNGRGWISYGDMRGTTYLWPQDGRQVGGALSELRKRTGIDFDLPTEAQWEFACRAGTSTALYTGENLTGETTSANLDPIAWYSGNASNQHEVGLLQPNAFGLYDMLGNVGEFCVDRINHNGLTSGAFTEPVGIESGDNHAIRGGSYAKAANHARAAHRQDYVNSGNRYGECGFRLWAPAIAK